MLGASPSREADPVASGLKSPLPWFLGDRRAEAVRSLCEYMDSYTGRFFEQFAGQSDPNRFEPSDLVAVSCLAVNVPPAASAWLLLGEGRQQTGDLLKSIGQHGSTLQEEELAGNPSALELWRLLLLHRDVGPTTASKLMAAKRPHLVPIYDSYVAAALLPEAIGPRWEWWAPWQALLRGPEADDLCAAVEDVRRAAADGGAPVEQLSILRIIDIVIWHAEEQRRRERVG